MCADTFVENASGEVVFPLGETSGAPAETCRFGADGKGTCVDVIPVTAIGSSAGFVSSTVSGVVVPFYTLTAPTPSPSGPSQSSAVLRSPLTIWNALAVVVAFMHAV